MKVLFFSPFALWAPHFELDLDLIQTHLDKGDECIVLGCGGELARCEPNAYHWKGVCRACIDRRKAGMQWLNSKEGKLQSLPFLNLTQQDRDHVEKVRSHNFLSLGELKDLQVEGFDAGLAVLSSLISEIREPEPNVRRYRRAIAKHLDAAVSSYFSNKNHLRTLKPDLFYVFNGRMASVRGALRAGQAAGVETIIHERGGVPSKFWLVENNYPHAVDPIIDQMEAMTKDVDPKEIEDVANEWLEERVRGVPQAWKSFVEGQKKILPAGLEEAVQGGRLIFTIFNSSEDEMKAVSEWASPLYESQAEANIKVLEAIQTNYPTAIVYLRMHPNLRGSFNSQVQSLHRLERRFPSLRLISAESPVSTYLLASKSNLIITFGSTVGVEVLRLDRPALLLGRAYYERMVDGLVVHSWDDLPRIMAEALQLKNVKKTFAKAWQTYGYFMSKGGYSPKYLDFKGPFQTFLKRGSEKIELLHDPFNRLVLRLYFGLRILGSYKDSLLSRLFYFLKRND